LVGSGQYDAALIKDEAVGTDLGKKYVLVLEKDNAVQYRAIELGPKLAGLRIVRSGLAEGEKIVVNGLQRAFPGSTVDPQSVPMADEKTQALLTEQRQAIERQNSRRVAAKSSPASTAPRG
jgi:membrane fusion protein, multidrug efflux system